jgi:hypothetical protein
MSDFVATLLCRRHNILVENNRMTVFSCRQVRNVDRKEKMVSCFGNTFRP